MFVKPLLMTFCRRRCCCTRPPSCQMPKLTDVGSRHIFDREHDVFRESVRKFMRQELAPLQEGFEENGRPSKEIWKALGKQGLLGVSIPEEQGGIGGTFKDEAIVLEEQCYAFCPSPSIEVHSTICLPYFSKYATKDQLEAYMPSLVSGEKVCAIAMTEPDAGSDLQGIRTHARVQGEDFILNGSKTFITHGSVANTILVVAVTDSEAKSKAHGLSIFIVDDDMPGFHRGRSLKKLGGRGVDTAELFFEDVRVPRKNIIGVKNQGFYQLMNLLPRERLVIGATCLSWAEWLFEMTREYVCHRKAFGSTISSLQTVQHRLAEMKTSIAVCRAFMDQCIDLHSRGSLSSEMASMAKYWASDLENRVAAECVQLHGGMGYMLENPVARAYANARVHTIYGGTNEIMKELIGRSIVRQNKHSQS